MDIIVAKFGGSSLASAAQFRKVKNIIEADTNRRYVVPSAPGKRFSGDEKVTDLLYKCNALAMAGEDISPVFDIIESRFLEIAKELEITSDIARQLEIVKYSIQNGQSADYAASRGEYLNGILLAAYLGYEFVDAAEVISFDARGAYDAARTYEQLGSRLENIERAVVPGFYGSRIDGSIKTFSRGGSDITGAIVARAVNARLYENWTDVSGFLMADPRIVENPKPIEVITYRELRELSYMGAGVLHEEAIFPVKQAQIPINIRNTNRPQDRGTTIVADAPPHMFDTITGIAGHKGFTAITIDKAMMNSELGFGRRVLKVLEDHGISFEHLPTGIDTMTVVVADSSIDGKLDDVVTDLYRVCKPDSIEITTGLSLIATVGRGMVRQPGTASRLFAALKNSHVNVRMIDQGSSEMNIIVAIETADFNKAIVAIYEAFVQ
ncbi:MAG: aspartate kinase [Clostridia bacterium]|nr:aspartate kinase [Clostridia bacterium]MBQ4638045.1 aspartate kinase [Clostridia bacterium]